MKERGAREEVLTKLKEVDNVDHIDFEFDHYDIRSYGIHGEGGGLYHILLQK